MPDLKSQTAAQTTNHLLAALPIADYQRLLPQFTLIELKYAKIVYEAGAVIREVYFPLCGIVSLLAAVGNKSTLEVGIVGNEGMIGLPIFLGAETSSSRAIVQGAGSALMMTAADFREEISQNSLLNKLLKRFTHSLLTQISQSAACYRFHLIEARLARWLLMTGDRMQADDFPITQDFLSNMLGVRREAVTKAAGALQRLNLIRYGRGSLSILDRAGLEASSCVCYEIIKTETENLLLNRKSET